MCVRTTYPNLSSSITVSDTTVNVCSATIESQQKKDDCLFFSFSLFSVQNQHKMLLFQHRNTTDDKQRLSSLLRHLTLFTTTISFVPFSIPSSFFFVLHLRFGIKFRGLRSTVLVGIRDFYHAREKGKCARTPFRPLSQSKETKIQQK